MDSSDRVLFRFAPVRGESREIMSTDKMSACALHDFEIDRTPDMPNPAVLQWWEDMGQPDSVTIDFSFCRKTRVKIIQHILGAKNPNGWRQQRVKRFNPTRG